MRTLIGYITVFFGAGIGGALRHAANRAGAQFGMTFPWSTLCVNVSGSLAMGLIAGWFAFRGQSGQTLRLFLTTGLLGGYTTFSAFSLDAALLWERGEVWASLSYIASSVLLSFAGVFLGLAIIRQLPV
ncbi:MAG: fluoride efflux transporter CrcB [Alphaproteobacteria bacterium]|nr:fluoride efflux transporter CrcB [Alphaproteobacteria bacterium]